MDRNLPERATHRRFGRLVRQQVVWSIFGLLAYAAASNIDYRRHIRRKLPGLWTGADRLVAVYFFPAVNGAQRWIRIAGVGVQPSEFAKVAFIAALSAFLMHRDITAGFSTGVLWPLLMSLVADGFDFEGARSGHVAHFSAGIVRDAIRRCARRDSYDWQWPARCCGRCGAK